MNSNTDEKKVDKKQTDLEKKAFGGLIILSFIGIIYIFRPFISTIIVAFIAALLLSPVYNYLGRFKKLSPVVKTVLVTLFMALLFIIPITILIMSVVKEAPQFFTVISDYLDNNSIDDISRQITSWIDNLHTNEQISEALGKIADSLAKIVLELLTALGGLITDFLSGLITSIVPFFTNLIIFMAVCFSLLPNLKGTYAYLRKISPLDTKITDLFIKRITETTSSMIFASVTISIISGFIVGITFTLLGIPFAALAALGAIILGFIPMIGPSLITVPTAILLVVVNGDWTSAIIVLAVHFFIINNIDLVVRPIFYKEDAKINPVVSAIAVLGGLAAFGILGVIYGPLIVIIFITCLQIYIPNYVTPDVLEPKTEKKDPVKRFFGWFQRKTNGK